MNITVINVKDLLKYTIGLICIICICIIVIRFIDRIKSQEVTIQIKENTKSIINKFTDKAFLSYLDVVFPIASTEKKEDNYIIGKDEKRIKAMFNIQLGMIESIKSQNSEVIQKEEKVQEEPKKLELAETSLTTEVLSDRNIEATYTNTNGKVEVKNRTDYEITRRNEK